MHNIIAIALSFFLTIGAAYGKTERHHSRVSHPQTHVVSYHQSSVVPRDRLPGSVLVAVPHPGFPWCGWEMRQLVPSDPGPAFNLARNWERYGTRADGPAPGVIAVWPHHVAMIVKEDHGHWVVKEGNYNGKFHYGPRSLAGVIAYREVS